MNGFYPKLVSCFALLVLNVPGQTQPPPAGGLETPWDVRKILASLTTDNQQLKPVLTQLSPQEWYDQKGASSTYIIQWQTAKSQVDDVMNVTARLGQKTEDLSLALDTYFRLEILDITTRSVLEGAQKYSDRAVSGKLSELIAHNFNNRERFREYLRNLATTQQENFKVADSEAQRCRGMISQQTPTKTRKAK